MALGANEGDAYIEVHADADPYARELPGAVERASETEQADRVLEAVGEHFGEKIAKSTAKELETHDKDITRAIERATERTEVRFRGRFNFFQRLRGRRGGARSLVEDLEEEIEAAVTSSAASGGFSKAGQAIRDAIGASFNISGKSPLVPFLVPLIGAIVGLVVAALQGVNALIGALATLPALLGAIGLQVGILFLAFHGMGNAISAAFQAKNAQELNEALKDLQPTAQEFVRALLPIKDIFSYLQRAAQINFFMGLGTDEIKGLLAFLNSDAFKGGVKQLASQLGIFFGQLAAFFSNTSFREFVLDVFPATIGFLQKFGPSFVEFLTGLLRMADASLPFLNQLGVMLGNLLAVIGDFLADAVLNGDFQAWMDDMTTSFASLIELILKVTKFVAVFLTQLDKAGGDKVIDELANAFEQLTTLLASPVGEKFMKGLIEFSILAIDSFTGLIELFVLLVAGITWLVDTGIPDAITGLGILFGKIGGWISDFFTMVGQGITDFFEWVGQAVLDGVNAIGKFFSDMWHDAGTKFSVFVNTIRDWIIGLPGKIVGWAKNFGSTLVQAGRDLINGLIDGIKAMLPDLSGVLGWVTDQLPDWKGPESKDRKILMPSGKAVMKGFAEGLQLGAYDVRSMLGEMTANMTGINNSSNIAFGPNSIQIRFSGTVPSQQQAMQTGMAVGSGITNQLAVRNTRLGVRSL